MVIFLVRLNVPASLIARYDRNHTFDKNQNNFWCFSINSKDELLLFTVDIFWILVAGLFLLAGVIGCLVPLLPGPPLSYIGFLFVQLKSDPPFTWQFMLVWAGIVLIVSVLDYLIPVYGTKKMGGTKFGMWGCMIGLFAGIWLGPWGIILGPFFGALIGEMIGSNHTGAFMAALGSFIGFLFSTLLKLIVCVIMCWYFVMALFAA